MSTLFLPNESDFHIVFKQVHIYLFEWSDSMIHCEINCHILSHSQSSNQRVEKQNILFGLELSSHFIFESLHYMKASNIWQSIEILS